MNRKLFFGSVILLMVIMFSSCSFPKALVINYQVDNENTGTLVLQPSRATGNTSVTINDNLLVDNQYVKKVTIKNIPEGEYDVHYISNNSWYKNKLDQNFNIKMKKNKIVTKLIEVPPYSTGYWIYQGCVYSAEVTSWILIMVWLSSL